MKGVEKNSSREIVIKLYSLLSDEKQEINGGKELMIILQFFLMMMIIIFANLIFRGLSCFQFGLKIVKLNNFNDIFFMYHFFF